jgi:hypothetical protein
VSKKNSKQYSEIRTTGCGFNNTNNDAYNYYGTGTVSRSYTVTPPGFSSSVRTLSSSFPFIFTFPMSATATSSVYVSDTTVYQITMVTSVTSDMSTNGKTVTLQLQTKYPYRAVAIYNATATSPLLSVPGSLTTNYSVNTNNEAVQQHVLASTSCAAINNLVLRLTYTMSCRADAVGCVQPNNPLFSAGWYFHN